MQERERSMVLEWSIRNTGKRRDPSAWRQKPVYDTGKTNKPRWLDRSTQNRRKPWARERSQAMATEDTKWYAVFQTPNVLFPRMPGLFVTLKKWANENCSRLLITSSEFFVVESISNQSSNALMTKVLHAFKNKRFVAVSNVSVPKAILRANEK